MYICQDPVRLEGERCNLYGYVTNTNKHVDILEVIDYAEKKKMVTPEEAKLLSSQCKGK